MYVYIYIYIYRERERETPVYSKFLGLRSGVPFPSVTCITRSAGSGLDWAPHDSIIAYYNI